MGTDGYRVPAREQFWGPMRTGYRPAKKLTLRTLMERKTPLWSLLTCMNGGLAGMVASCAACDNMHNGSAIAVGFFAGITYFWLADLAIKCGIDDPLGKRDQISTINTYILLVIKVAITNVAKALIVAILMSRCQYFFSLIEFNKIPRKRSRNELKGFL